MTRERLIEIYEAELRVACNDIGGDFDLARDDIDFTGDPSQLVSLYDSSRLTMPHTTAKMR